jgi:hypothetical protein
MDRDSEKCMTPTHKVYQSRHISGNYRREEIEEQKEYLKK